MDETPIDIIFRQSNRITLRPISLSDAPLLAKWMNDPRVTQFLTAYMPMTIEDERSWVENLSKRKPNNIVVMLEADNKPIGTMGIHHIDHRNGTATTGTAIGEREFWGKGYGSEAKMLLLEYAFNTLNLRKIRSEVIAFNERSVNYSLKCGYKVEGRLKAEYFKNGIYWDKVMLAVFREDFEPLWELFKEEHKSSLLT